MFAEVCFEPRPKHVGPFLRRQFASVFLPDSVGIAPGAGRR